MALCFSIVIVAVGCATSSTSTTTGAIEPDGARLWAQNCIRCHNGRPPSEYSSAQWDVVMLHMRVRAGLAANDARLIREFLQTTN
jgi:hypothetical protein